MRAAFAGAGDLTITLRDYQEELIEAAREKLRKIKEDLKRRMIDRGPRLLIQCPTGGGKTVLASFITRERVKRSGTVRFLCHRDFLVDQTSGTFGKVGIDHSYIASGRWLNAFSPVHVCMVQSVRSRLKRVSVPDLALWDECHHLGARTWHEIMEAWATATHIGLSATPQRGDGKGLDQHFDDIVIGPTVAHLISIGALSDYKYFAPTSPDLATARVRMGDYVKEDADKAVIIGDLVEHYAKLARGKKAIYFAPSIKQSIDTAAAFNASGFRFVHLDGGHSPWERGQAALMLARGELDGLINVDLFGEGFDLAAAASQAAGHDVDVTVEAVGLARITKSLALSRQQIGRVLRPKREPGIILDHAGHLDEFGLPDDEVEWTLAGTEHKNQGSIQCVGCGAALQKQANVCRHCGMEVEKVTRKSDGKGAGREVEFQDGDLQEVDREKIRLGKKVEEWEAAKDGLDALIELGRRRGYKFPEQWAAKVHTMTAQRDQAKKDARLNGQMNFMKEMGF